MKRLVLLFALLLIASPAWGEIKAFETTEEGQLKARTFLRSFEGVCSVRSNSKGDILWVDCRGVQHIGIESIYPDNYEAKCAELERLKAENAELRAFKDWYRKAYGDPERNGWVAHDPKCRWETRAVNLLDFNDMVNSIKSHQGGEWEPFAVYKTTLFLKRRVCE